MLVVNCSNRQDLFNFDHVDNQQALYDVSVSALELENFGVWMRRSVRVGFQRLLIVHSLDTQ